MVFIDSVWWWKKANHLNKLALFIDQYYADLDSLLNLDIDKAELDWIYWLEKKGIKTHRNIQNKIYGIRTHKKEISKILRMLYLNLYRLTDNRDEWEKDKWDVRNLHKDYGIDYIKSSTNYIVNFTNINEVNIRNQVKKYFKQRLLSKNNFSWSTAREYIKSVSTFLTFILSLEPTWTNLKDLKRVDMEKYIRWLHKYAKENIKQGNTNEYVARSLKKINKFLTDIQHYEYELSPILDTRLLIFSQDIPKPRKRSIDQVKYIPDFVLDQLFNHINDLHKDVIPIVWIAFKTGLRISDILGLKTNCLLQINGEYSIVADIEKTYVKGHRIPIDEDLANILAVLIRKSNDKSNIENNPQGFIFIRYRGSRKGKPFAQGWVQSQLNILSREKNIIDEKGDLFHFNFHQFRHTYAVKMLNGGADIITVQELLAHASPEMTMRYAKLLDNTKRKVFEKVVKQGVFTFDLNGEIHHIPENQEVPENILDILWQNEKLNALENPYGSCRARVNGNCPLAAEPPCLTANDGKPCFDLAVGISDMDIKKYELHIESTSKMIEASKQFGREDMIEANQKNLKRYQKIYDTIKKGNVIYGRLDRLKREIERKGKSGAKT